MSHSPTDSDDQDRDAYLAGWQAVNKMIREGRSWSGHERHCSFLNLGGKRFVDISAVSGLDFPDDGRAIAIVDWDFDGLLDLWIRSRTGPRLRLMRNQSPSENHFLALHLSGRTSNRDGIGARVELYLRDKAGRKLIKTSHAGGGYLSQSSKWIHFGLGQCTELDRVVVRWPGGEPQTFTDLQVDRRYRLIQGRLTAEAWMPPGGDVTLVATKLEAPQMSDRVRIALATRMPLPELEYIDLKGQSASLFASADKPVLLLLWASWCAPCAAELSELGDHREALNASGLQVLALSVDEPANYPQARALLRRVSWPLSAGFAPPELVDVLDVFQRHVLERQRSLAVPTAFLIDSQRRVAVIYKGSTQPRQILEDVAGLRGTPETFRRAATPFEGRWLAPPPAPEVVIFANELTQRGLVKVANQFLSGLSAPSGEKQDTARRRLAEARFAVGVTYSQQGKYAEASDAYRQALELDPDHWNAHNNLGNALARLGRPEQAVREYEESLRINPDHADTHDNLALSLAALGRTDEAIEHHREATRLNPSHPKAHHNLAIMLRRAGQLEEAFASARRAVEADPENFLAQGHLGVLLERKGQLSEAIPRYRAALRLNPDHQTTIAKLATLHAQQGAEAQALEFVAILHALNPTRAEELLVQVQELLQRS